MGVGEDFREQLIKEHLCQLWGAPEEVDGNNSAKAPHYMLTQLGLFGLEICPTPCLSTDLHVLKWYPEEWMLGMADKLMHLRCSPLAAATHWACSGSKMFPRAHQTRMR